MASREALAQVKEKTMGTVDAALTLLERYPVLDDTNSNISVNLSLKPFEVLLDLAKRLWGYDLMVDIVSYIIVAGLPPLEAAIKTILITNIKNMLSCSVNPFISYDMINEGFVFDLRTIDIMGTLYKNPLRSVYNSASRSIDMYYYFDNDMTKADDLVKSKDFNCFLWYVKNKSTDREVWKGTWYQGADEEDTNARTTNIVTKQSHKSGVMTLEFKERSGALLTAEGSGLNLQTPYNNCLHVFIGNEGRTDNSTQSINEQLLADNDKLSQYAKARGEFENIINEIDKDVELRKANGQKISSEEKKAIKKEKATIRKIISVLSGGSQSLAQSCNQYFAPISNNAAYKYTSDYLGTLSVIVSSDIYGTPIGAVEASKKTGLDARRLALRSATYMPVESNYYYHKPLFVFNTDYIMSIRLFDYKVVAAQLIDALTGAFSLDLNLTYQERLVRHEVARMTKEIIENDDTFVSDCFFSFSNDEYNAMLEKTNRERMGFTEIPNDPSGYGSLDTAAIIDSLNSISPTATSNEAQTTIRHILEQVSVSAGAETNRYDYDSNINARFSAIENMMNTLAYVIVMAIMSPKVYLVLALNLRIMGQEEGVDMTKFIDDNKNLICTLIRGVRDMLFDMFFTKIKETLGELAEALSTKLLLEQYEYYKELLASCTRCLQMMFGNGGTEGWSMGEVTADIDDGTDISGAAPTDIEFNKEC